jgi:hypothetical protein
MHTILTTALARPADRVRVRRLARRTLSKAADTPPAPPPPPDSTSSGDESERLLNTCAVCMRDRCKAVRLSCKMALSLVEQVHQWCRAKL